MRKVKWEQKLTLNVAHADAKVHNSRTCKGKLQYGGKIRLDFYSFHLCCNQSINSTAVVWKDPKTLGLAEWHKDKSQH